MFVLEILFGAVQLLVDGVVEWFDDRSHRHAHRVRSALRVVSGSHAGLSEQDWRRGDVAVRPGELRLDEFTIAVATLPDEPVRALSMREILALKGPNTAGNVFELHVDGAVIEWVLPTDFIDDVRAWITAPADATALVDRPPAT